MTRESLSPPPGLSKELLDTQGVPLSVALATLRAHLPRNAVLVGQSISTDVKWLGLQEGTDFAGLVDLAGLYRVWNTQYKSWSVFGQDHLARMLLGVDNAGCVDNAAVPVLHDSYSCQRRGGCPLSTFRARH
jgi:hypothetical protein